jgi:hypothetical protein
MCLKLRKCPAAGLVQTISFTPRQTVTDKAAQTCDERQFERMHEVYRRSGGLASGDSIVYHLRTRCDQPISTLARWIANRSIVAFEWRGAQRIPLFQFSDECTILLPAVTAAMRELNDVFTDWEIATWFASPNEWLLDQWPCAVIHRDPSEVVARFIAQG